MKCIHWSALALAGFALAGCATMASGQKPAPQQIQKFVTLDYETLYKVASDVIVYCAHHDIDAATTNKIEGHLESQWLVNAGPMQGNTYRTKVVIDFLRDKKRPEAGWVVEVMTPRELNESMEDPEAIKKPDWEKDGTDQELLERVLFNLNYRIERIERNRAAGLPDPVFNDFRLE